MIGLPYKPTHVEAIDIDEQNQANLLRIYFNACYLFGISNVSVKISPSGRGYHIYCNDRISIDVANALCDCQGRLKWWEIQGFSFTFKKKKLKGRWGVEEEFEILNYGWISKLPAIKQKVRKKNMYSQFLLCKNCKEVKK